MSFVLGDDVDEIGILASGWERKKRGKERAYGKREVLGVFGFYQSAGYKAPAALGTAESSYFSIGNTLPLPYMLEHASSGLAQQRTGSPAVSTRLFISPFVCGAFTSD